MSNSTIPSYGELSETLINVLSLAINDNFSPEFQTYAKSFLQLSERPDGANLFPAEDANVIPLFFSENPDDNFPNTTGNLTNFLTASSDPNVLATEDQELKIIWGRHGSDSIFGFDPGVDNQGKRRIDFFTGDYIDEQIFLGGNDGSFREWQDRFILGDWQKPYYYEDDDTLGLNQFSLIIDFNSNQDIIELHGTAEDYKLVDTNLGKAIFWQQEDSYDLIAVTGGVYDLSLEGEYFEFKGDTPPETTIEEAEQIGTSSNDYLFASTTDDEGNVYVGGGTGGSLADTNLGARDAWVTKYDNHGNEQWSQQFGSEGTESLWDMASDGTNLYVAGNTTSELDNNTSQGGNDVYLAKYDSDGNQQWIKQYGTLTFDESFRVTADTSGNVYVGGHTIGGLAGDNQNVGQSLGMGVDGGVPSTDSYVAKYDTNGNEVWVQQFGTVTLDDNWGVAVDQEGNVFAGGNTKGNFGGENAGALGEYDNWLVKLNKDDGQVEWVQQFGVPDYDFLWDMETDSMGNFYATGWTLGDLGGENAGSYDTWLAKYDTNGNQLWIRQFGTSGDDSPYLNGLEVDSNDNVFLTGQTDGSLVGENAGSYDAWATKYDADGNQLWLQQFGTPDYDVASAVTADNYDNLYVSGMTEGSLGDTNAGAYDSWVAKLNSNTGTIQDFNNTETAQDFSDTNDII